MNKDVIYIDTEDDVTAIIGKVKDAKEKVVALVPPKRTGVLQSAVNLRILQRTAKSANKHLVLITNDSSLIPLAASASIPVAKNLQSRPEIPEIAALVVDDDDDIIDGSQLPVGEHAATTSKSAAAAKHIPVASASDDAAKKSYASPPKEGDSPRKAKAKNKGGKVPNFGAFRKRLIFIIAALLLLVGFLVWAIFFAPRATVELKARTSDEALATSIVLTTSGDTNAEEGTIKALQVEEKSEQSVEFEATGTETSGERATGTVTLLNCGSRRSVDVEVGTAVSYGNYNFLTTRTVTVPGGASSAGDFGGCDRPGRANVQVRAQEIGEEYNLASGTEFTVAGRSGLTASSRSDFSGGSKRTFKIVTQADVQAASERLAQQGSEEVKQTLADRFPRNAKAIDSSFRGAAAEVASSPAVGDEAPDGKAQLTSSVTYLMNGVSNSELENYVKKAVEMRLSKENDQRIYDSGVSEASFNEFVANDVGGTVNLSVTAKVGPQVKDDEIKKRVAGKRYGEIQSDLTAIPGIEDVDIRFWPFWVSSVPDKENRINVKFDLIDEGGNNS